jgi:SDR family mycofactocin-dependent oxidoreductase
MFDSHSQIAAHARWSKGITVSRFDGKVALVTGAARGQGRSHALALAAEGADIIAIDICRPIETLPYGLATSEDLASTAREIEALDRRVVAAECDVRSTAELARAVADGTSQLGPIDIVLANSGVWSMDPLWEMSDEKWQDMIDVNLTGAFKTVRAVAPGMIERHRGAIVMTSSVSGVEAGAGFAHYVASKHGVIGLMKNVALELAPYGIRCNAVLPGLVDTAINDWQGAYDMMKGSPGGTREDRSRAAHSWGPLANRGLMAPSSVSKTVLWLASDDAANITGISVPIDAGHLLLPGLDLAPVIDDPAADPV